MFVSLQGPMVGSLMRFEVKQSNKSAKL